MNPEERYNEPLLPDPKKDRVVTNLPPPPHKPLPSRVLFPEGTLLRDNQ